MTPPLFAVGDISDAIYDSNCYFADPTVRFSGLAKWKGNLKLLVPFLIEPKIQLTKLESQEQGAQQAPLLQVTTQLLCTALLHFSVMMLKIAHTCVSTHNDYMPLHSDTLVQAHWTLQTYLKLPWRPFIDVIGATEYSLNAEANQVRVPTTQLVVLIDLLQCIFTGHAQ